MAIMGYQDTTVEMVPKVRKAWQVPVDHVVLKEKRVELERSLLKKETGNSARGKRVTAVILALLRSAVGNYRFLYSVSVLMDLIAAIQKRLSYFPFLSSLLSVTFILNI